jgi:hypothetical protein
MLPVYFQALRGFLVSLTIKNSNNAQAALEKMAELNF